MDGLGCYLKPSWRINVCWSKTGGVDPFYMVVNRFSGLHFQVSIDPIGYLNLLSKNKHQVAGSDARN